MAIERIPAEDVYKYLMENKSRLWPSPLRGNERLFPVAQPAVQPGFHIDSSAKIVTMGSCFARNVERNLQAMGCRVLSAEVDDVFDPFPDRVMFQRFNKYTVHSILQELGWAFGERAGKTEDALIETPKGEFADFQTAGEALQSSETDMARFRREFTGVFGRLRQADVFILTLGLVECWFDKETRLYLNVAPSLKLCKMHPGRFEFRRLDHDEVYQALCNTHDIVTKHNPSIRMLVTVSPVPLASTFSRQDVLQANCYSKSVQRAAVEKFVAERGVDYFPSYEALTLSDHRHVFGDADYRHVQRPAVQRVMGKVLESYIGESEQASIAHALGMSVVAERDGDFETAVRIIHDHHERYSKSPALANTLGKALLGLGRLKEAREAISMFNTTNAKEVSALKSALGEHYDRECNRANGLRKTIDRTEAAAEQRDPELTRALTILSTLSSDNEKDRDVAWLRNFLLSKVPPQSLHAPAKTPEQMDEADILRKVKFTKKTSSSTAALTELKKVLQAKPETPPLVLLRAQLNTEVGNYQAALEDFERVTEMAKGQELAYIAARQGLNWAKRANDQAFLEKFRMLSEA